MLWHFGIILITSLKSSRHNRPAFERLLRLAELDLLEDLKKRLKGLPREKLEEKPYELWLKQTKNYIARIREKYD